ncbi:MAG: elongation factor 4 [Chloroflexi bacterium]|nr:elongation factor 4 [Chloroflexota bacterium]
MACMRQSHIRNFCIIAHIDHGKSTLADRLLEYTGTISSREMEEQVLDSMDLERERGITIKAQAVRMTYRAADGQEYELNLVDTPGHVDFTYEVSRSLAACEGAILVVDAAQGIQAQTLANVYAALDRNLTVIPVINKIDLPNAQPERVAAELQDVIGFDADEIIYASAKEGAGTSEILQAVVERMPPPAGHGEGALRALIFDSKYDSYKGVVAFIRVVDGSIDKGGRLQLMETGRSLDALEIGYFHPSFVPIERLVAGEIGYVATGLKNVEECQVGDTITQSARPASGPLPGYRPVKPMVFTGLYPMEAKDYGLLRDALTKLKLNDASLSFEPETSIALGFGFRCGFLGLLHMEIVKERLEREYGLNLLITAPSVEYEVTKSDGSQAVVDNPAELPSGEQVEEVREPWLHLTIVAPSRYIGTLMELVTSRRGQFGRMEYLDSGNATARGDSPDSDRRVLLEYTVPLAEFLVDFFDEMKSRTQGYASIDYTFAGYRPAELVKLDILVNGQPVDALSLITHKEEAYYRGKELVAKLRRLIPRQLFEVAVQAAIGQRVIARETIPALRKNVLAKCYGGDVTRKRKLLEKQAEGKKRMKRVGSVEIPQEAFMAVLKLEK